MKEFKEALWKIIRNEGIVVNNQNLDWLLDRAEKLLINENKSNNFDVKSNEELFKQALVEGLNRRFDREIEEAKKIEQIEEMARDICKLGISCEECTMLARKTNQTREQYCKAFEYAKRAYNAGYRKQSEGEWIYEHSCDCLDGTDAPLDYKCSLCGELSTDPFDYCQHCGAKMKYETTQKYFSPEEVKKMTPKEVRENYDLVIQSMRRW